MMDPAAPEPPIDAGPANIAQIDQLRWRGNLVIGEILAIHGATCSQGTIATGKLPGTHVRVDASNLPLGLQIAQIPSTRNGFTLRLRNIGAAPVTDFTLYYRQVR